MAVWASEARKRPSERECSVTVHDRIFAFAMSVVIVPTLSLVSLACAVPMG